MAAHLKKEAVTKEELKKEKKKMKQAQKKARKLEQEQKQTQQHKENKKEQIRQSKQLNLDDQGKVITKYDKKKLEKEQAQKRAKRVRKITAGVLIALAAAIITVVSVNAFQTYNRVHKKYIAIGGQDVSEIEFDFYYGLAKNSMLSQTLYGTMTYADYFSSYLGYSTSKSDESQTYSSTSYTWYDYFANNAVSAMKQYKALLQAAQDNNFDYTTGDSDYQTFTDQVSTAASSAGQSLSAYYKSVYGSHATESNVKSYVMEYLKATAYQTQLTTDLAATDSEIQTYYQENKDTYDTVTYQSYTTTDATDTNNIAEASESANTAKSSISDSDTASWLFDSSRQAGDHTVLTGSDGVTYTVLYFESRQYDSSNDSTIASAVLSQKYQEFLKTYTDSMTVDNIDNRVKMLSEE